MTIIIHNDIINVRGNNRLMVVLGDSLDDRIREIKARARAERAGSVLSLNWNEMFITPLVEALLSRDVVFLEEKLISDHPSPTQMDEELRTTLQNSSSTDLIFVGDLEVVDLGDWLDYLKQSFSSVTLIRSGDNPRIEKSSSAPQMEILYTSGYVPVSLPEDFTLRFDPSRNRFHLSGSHQFRELRVQVRGPLPRTSIDLRLADGKREPYEITTCQLTCNKIESVSPDLWPSVNNHFISLSRPSNTSMCPSCNKEHRFRNPLFCAQRRPKIFERNDCSSTGKPIFDIDLDDDRDVLVFFDNGKFLHGDWPVIEIAELRFLYSDKDRVLEIASTHDGFQVSQAKVLGDNFLRISDGYVVFLSQREFS